MSENGRGAGVGYNRLYYFYLVAREGSMRLAAEALGITSPSVSDQVKKLEEELGEALFERTPRRLVLTERGRYVFERAAEMFRIGEEVFSDPSDDTALSNRVVLDTGASPGVTQMVRAKFFAPLFARDDVRCVVVHESHTQLVRRLLSGELDFVLLADPPVHATDRGLDATLICEDELVLVGKDPTRWPRHGVKFMHYRAGTEIRERVEDWLAGTSARPEVAGETDNADVMIRVASQSEDLFAAVPRDLAEDFEIPIVEALPVQFQVYGVVRADDAGRMARRAIEDLMSR